MLRLLSGRVHEVLTAVVIVAGEPERSRWSTDTVVRFSRMTDARNRLVRRVRRADGEGRRYGIQGRGARFIDRIEGSWSNVVGLPVAHRAPAAE